MGTDLISLQLFTVRDAPDATPTETFARIREAGYTQVEVYGIVPRFETYRDGLAASGLTASAGHSRLVGQDLDEIFGAARELGITTVYDPFIDSARWTTPEDVESIAKDLNEIAKKATEYGITIGYHNHEFEFENRFDGISAFEYLARHLDPEVVLELDTYWAVVGGEPDVGALLERLGNRVTALHIKDGPLTKVDEDQVAVGAGQMDFAPILSAAPTAQRVVELDGHEGDVFVAITESYRHLAGVGAAA